MDERLQGGTFWPRLGDALADVPDEDRRPPEQARVGAVLVLLEQTEEGPRVVLTRRRRDMRSHPGQVSFPGGRLDADETLEEAALREAWEEVGLRAGTVEIVGTGPTFYIPPSRFWVAPVVARWREPHALAENPWEVDEILHVPLAQLLERDRWRHAPLSLRGSTWAWQLDGDVLWGATAMVMSLLLDIAVEDWSDGVRPEELGERLAVRPWENAPAWERRPRLVGDLPAVAQQEVAHVTVAQMRTVRAWLDERGIGELARAEQAGRALVAATRRLRGGELRDLSVSVLAGPSSNGAGGLAAARLLASAGARVHVLAVGEARHRAQVQLLRDAGVAIDLVAPEHLDDARSPGEVVLDAMLGIGAEPPLRDLPEATAEWLRRHDVPVLSLDLPSGISADGGLKGPCVTSEVTVALGAPTMALHEAIVHPYAGDLYLADIGIPAAAWRAAGVEAPAVFGNGPLVRLTAENRAPDAGTPDQAERSN